MLKRVNELWGLPKTFDRFPGSQPISIERRHFPLLRKNEYVICDKSDGERFLCLIDGNTCCLIDRKCDITHIKIRPPRNVSKEPCSMVKSLSKMVKKYISCLML